MTIKIGPNTVSAIYVGQSAVESVYVTGSIDQQPIQPFNVWFLQTGVWFLQTGVWNNNGQWVDEINWNY
jgi:hypothetical protein